jgi:protein-S-isoprenylcysteine O-methyltransferase Ste14
MKLIPNAKQVALRSYSQRAQAAALALIGGYQLLPDKLQDALPMSLVIGTACVALVLGIIGRLIAQPSLHAPPTAEEPSRE